MSMAENIHSHLKNYSSDPPFDDLQKKAGGGDLFVCVLLSERYSAILNLGKTKTKTKHAFMIN